MCCGVRGVSFVEHCCDGRLLDRTIKVWASRNSWTKSRRTVTAVCMEFQQYIYGILEAPKRESFRHKYCLILPSEIDLTEMDIEIDIDIDIEMDNPCPRHTNKVTTE